MSPRNFVFDGNYAVDELSVMFTIEAGHCCVHCDWLFESIVHEFTDPT